MKTIFATLLALFATLLVAAVATPAQANPTDGTVVECWVHSHTMEVRTVPEVATHIAGETGFCAMRLATCTVLHAETREYRTPEQWVQHFARHAQECT